jgi:DNA-binding CsgD family transcriptional regulator
MNTGHAAIRFGQAHANTPTLSDGVAMKSWGPRLQNNSGERETVPDQTPTMADLLEQRTLERNSLTEVLNHLAIAVIIVDRKQRIVHSNAAAVELLAEGSIVRSIRGVLTANYARNQERLRRAIRAPEPDAKSLRLESDNRRVTVATVLPLSSGLYAVYRGPHTAIFVHRQPSFDEGLARTLATTFGLTGAEARVLSALLEGLSLSDIASRQQVSKNTIRSHLQHLFEKTNTRRQSDLVRIASAAIPPIRKTRRGKKSAKLCVIAPDCLLAAVGGLLHSSHPYP